MQKTILRTGAIGVFSAYPESAGNLLRVTGGKSFTDVLSAMRTMTGDALGDNSTAGSETDLLHLLPCFAPKPMVEPESFTGSGEYAKHLETKFGMRVTAKYFKKDQESMDALGRSMNGNDLVIAPNILDEMAANRETASYYEAKIQYWFDNIPKWKAESAAMGLTYEPCGVAIHEDGTVYYIGGGTETPERKAQIEAAQKAQREKKFKRRREQQEYIQQLILQKQTNALAENWAGIFTPPSASSTMTQKILPNGAVFLATKTSGVKRENPQPVFETD